MVSPPSSHTDSALVDESDLVDDDWKCFIPGAWIDEPLVLRASSGLLTPHPIDGVVRGENIIQLQL